MSLFSVIHLPFWDDLHPLWLGLAGAIGILFLILLLWWAGRPWPFPYQKRTCLFTPAERKFLLALEQVLPPDCRVFGQVRLADVLDIRPGLTRSQWGSAFARIKSKHLDFVICDDSSLEILFAVELDDSTHQRPDRIERDDFLNQAMSRAGIPLLRFPVQKTYSPRELVKALNTL